MTPALDSLASALQSPTPWLLPYVPIAQEVLRSSDMSSSATALNNAIDEVANAVRFIEHSVLPTDEHYETFIARTGCVPTRDNLHDLFNGLMWLCYPQTKRRLNALHAREIALHGTSGARGTLRDALTLFDENGAVLQAPAVLIDALRRRDWKTVFVKERALWQSARLLLFGHALLEKLLQPRKAITAHVWIVEELSDEVLAATIDETLTPKRLLPLPVLGVPGWWSANEQAEFYDDATVFRLPR